MDFKGAIPSAGVAKTFDAVFPAFRLWSSRLLLSSSQRGWRSDIWSKPMFWVALIAKFVAMTVVSLLGGLLCRRFASMDSKGYIVTSSSWFKVN